MAQTGGVVCADRLILSQRATVLTVHSQGISYGRDIWECQCSRQLQSCGWWCSDRSAPILHRLTFSHSLRAFLVVPQAKGSSLAALDKLPYADGASWNPTQACLPGTRATILSLVCEWSRLSDDHRIFCLKGVAGCGKTAISNTVAQALKVAGLLASCFFFDRANASRNTPRLLFSTIARDIASFYPAIAADIAATLEEEPALATAHLSRQFEAFIAGPLRRHQTDRPIVLVIDALDEAVPDDADADLLTILRDEVTQLPTHIRIFITTRPTRVIQQALSDEEHITSYTLAIDSVETQHDIAVYIDFMVRGKTMRSQMGTPWPDQALIDDLKIRAGPLHLDSDSFCLPSERSPPQEEASHASIELFRTRSGCGAHEEDR